MKTQNTKTIAFVLMMLAVTTSMVSALDTSLTGEVTGTVDSVVNANANANAPAQVNAQANANANTNANAKAKTRAKKALYVEETVNAVTAEDFSAEVETETESSVTIEDAVLEVESSAEASGEGELKASSFATASVGQGWATTTDEGMFARIVFVEKSFVNTQNNEEVTLNNGFIKLGNNPPYKLVLTAHTEHTLTFDVTARGKDKATGTLTLESQQSLAGFTVWKGTLKTESKTYDVMVATHNKKLKGNGKISAETKAEIEEKIKRTYADVDADAQIAAKTARAKGGFWARIKAFLGAEA
jgi:hypothetical protein